MNLKIYPIGQTNINIDALFSFLKEQGISWQRTPRARDHEEIVEIAGRICYMSFGENQYKQTNSEFIKNLIIKGHESVLEHASWSFLVTGISRSFTHQLVRHRVGFSFSQISQQYCDQTDTEFVEPKILRKYPEILTSWRNSIQKSKQTYKEILFFLRRIENRLFSDLEKAEVRRAVLSVARSILPNAAETKILVTANARALRHFFKLRGSIQGDEEMRYFAAEILKYLLSYAPSFFFDFSIKKLSDGSPIVIQNKHKENIE